MDRGVDHLYRLVAQENFSKSSWEMVIEDMFVRNKFGKEKYGVELTPSTTEDMLQHAYEEALDLAVYLKTEIIKRYIHV